MVTHSKFQHVLEVVLTNILATVILATFSTFDAKAVYPSENIDKKIFTLPI